jgi:hypothetical protein
MYYISQAVSSCSRLQTASVKKTEPGISPATKL